MVIFAGGKFRENVGKTFHVGIWVYFCMGVIFAKKTTARKTCKLPPRENFHVYSIKMSTKTWAEKLLKFSTMV